MRAALWLAPVPGPVADRAARRPAGLSRPRLWLRPAAAPEATAQAGGPGAPRGAARSRAGAPKSASSPPPTPAAGDTVAAFSGSRQEDTSRFTVTAAWKPAATAQGSGDYGAWAWSEGDMPHSITSGLGDSLAQAETAAVQACEAAGGGSGGSGGCYARAWFENAYSSFAY